jgi:hypothetical protein
LTLPTSEDGLYAWIIVLMLAYIGACYIVRFYRVLRSARTAPPTAQFFLAKMFDAGTFAVSVMLLIGIFDPPLLTLLGSTKPFLAIAALAGLGYTIHSLLDS